jgi:upstream activation factor subunit UAF30
MATKKTASKKTSGSGEGGGFAAPLQPDAALAAVIGSEPMPRTEVTKRVWDYIKQNNLQDPNDKRTIRADAKLKPVFDGKDAVSMFEMTKLVNNHLKK